MNKYIVRLGAYITTIEAKTPGQAKMVLYRSAKYWGWEYIDIRVRKA